MTTIFAGTALLPGGWAGDVAVEIGADGRIAAVRPGTVASTGAERAGVLLPAPGNLHSHAFQRAMAGLTEARSAEGDSFWTWRSLMYRFLERLTPDQVGAIAAQVQVEMLEAGFAAVGEFHYLHHGPDGAPYDRPAEMAHRVSAAAAHTGIGLTLLPVLYAQGGTDGRALAGGQRRFGCDLDGFARLVADARAGLPGRPDDRIGTAPHSLRAVPPGWLGPCAALTDGPVHIHAAEQEAEVSEVEAALGARPVAYLLDTAGADARWCLVHATRMTPGETAALARSGAVAGLCPVTEANLGDGIFDGARFVGAGGVFGVGSDSNLRISLAEELRQFEHSQRLRDSARAILCTPGPRSGAPCSRARRAARPARSAAMRARSRPGGWRIWSRSTRMPSASRAGRATACSTAGSSRAGRRRSTASGRPGGRSSSAGATRPGRRPPRASARCSARWPTASEDPRREPVAAPRPRNRGRNRRASVRAGAAPCRSAAAGPCGRACRGGAVGPSGRGARPAPIRAAFGSRPGSASARPFAGSCPGRPHRLPSRAHRARGPDPRTSAARPRPGRASRTSSRWSP